MGKSATQVRKHEYGEERMSCAVVSSYLLMLLTYFFHMGGSCRFPFLNVIVLGLVMGRSYSVSESKTLSIIDQCDFISLG